VEQDRKEVEKMYMTFADNGRPLPKDAGIIEQFGFTGEEKFFEMSGPPKQT
jgi:hypothetical protein